MMVHLNNRVDPLTDGDGQEPSPATRRLVATLSRAYRAQPSPHLDATMIAALQAGASTEQRLAALRLGRRPVMASRRLVSLGATLALAITGSVGYLRLSGPTPVSAQSVLSRAVAAMRMTPDQAAHFSYNVAVSPPPGLAGAKGPMLALADVWVQPGANGAPTRSSQTLLDSPAAPPPGQAAQETAARSGALSAAGVPPLEHYLQIGQQVYGYDGGNNAIVIPGSHNEHPGWMIPNAALDGAGVAQELDVLARHSPQQVHLLPQQTLDRIMVDVLQVNGWVNAPGTRTTFYFDAQSFLLRGFDAVSIYPSYPTPSWQVGLSSYSTVAASAVPPHTFSLNAPADAQLESPRPDFVGFASGFVSVCHGAFEVGQLEQILQARQQSLLAACQATAPSVSRDDLVAALIAPYKAVLDGAAATVQITQAQITAALAAQRQWLDTLVTTPGGGSSLN